jgi:light-regulated signal transduction histidine kinase (bacteriophytochrome)
VYERVGRYLLIAGVVLLMSLVATLFVSRLAQRSISKPIASLVDLTRDLSQRNDYSVRAHLGPDDAHELAVLSDAINEMLGGLQARERWLQDARDELEERVRARTLELEASNQELEAFSYSVSHDLRAPLRHVVGFANLLDQHAGSTLDERGRRYTHTIVEAAGRMGRLIDDLLAFSRMGRAAVSKQAVDLRSIVDDARAEVAPQAAGREINWTIHELPTVHADPALLRPAMINLLSNALKYTGTRERACIEIGTADAPEGEVVVFVKDNGVGFDMDYAHKLFGVFQRLHAGKEFSGTGIGLANVRRIIQRHGGRTWATGAVDAGATFFFSLPTPA